MQIEESLYKECCKYSRATVNSNFGRLSFTRFFLPHGDMCTCPGFHTVIYLTEMDKIENKLADMSPDQLSLNAQHIWQMLDDMAENNPAAYRKFIDKQMEESKKHNAKPKPHMCVKTTLTVSSSEEFRPVAKHGHSYRALSCADL